MTRFAQGPGDSPGFLLWRVTLRWQRTMTRVLQPLGLTHVQFVVLASAWWLNREDQRPNQSAVAAFADTDLKMTSEIVRKLDSMSLVELRVDPADRRARTIQVTAAGATLAAQAIEVVEQADADFFAAAPASIIGSLQKLAGYRR